MRKINIRHVKPGMVLSKTIYSNQGILLLKSGIKLSDKYIAKIKETGLEELYIEDSISQGIQIDDTISKQTKMEIEKAFDNMIEKVKNGYYNNSDAIFKKIQHIIEELLSNESILYNVNKMLKSDDYLLQHSINVCVLSIMLGINMNYNRTQLQILAVGALLHDIGKIKIQFDSYRYREAFTEIEFEIYKKHIVTGNEVLKFIRGISNTAIEVCLSHHERYDGTGFPNGKKKDEIHEFAKIIAVVNEYDNLVNNLTQNREMKHYEIIEFIISKAYTWFDPNIIKVFRLSIAPYPLSSGVVLSNGKKGIVSKINANFPARPVVRIINHSLNEVIEEIDLAHENSLLIVNEIDIDKS